MTELAYVPSPGQAGDGPSKGTVRVVLYVRAPEDRPETLTEAYHAVSTELAGTPGLLGNELLRNTLDEGGFVVLSYWTDLDAFRDWEKGASHRGTTSPLRPLQERDNGRHYGIYIVEAEH